MKKQKPVKTPPVLTPTVTISDPNDPVRMAADGLDAAASTLKFIDQRLDYEIMAKEVGPKVVPIATGK